MAGLDGRTLRVLWTLLVFATAVALVYAVRKALLIFVFAIFLAYVAEPVVGLVERFAPRGTKRAVSLAAAYLIILTLIGLIAYSVFSRATEQAATLASRLPELIKNIDKPEKLPLPWWIRPYQNAIFGALNDAIFSKAQEAIPLLTRAGGQLISALSSIIFLILVPILSFFLLKDGRLIRRLLLEQIGDAGPRKRLREMVDEIHNVMIQFVRAMVTISVVTSIVYGAALGLLSVPYSLLLALIAGALEAIPAAGPLVASLAIVLVAVVSGYQGIGWVVFFLVIYRVFLDYVLQPHLMSKGVNLPPLAVILAVFAGEQVGGIVGMILAIPLVAIVRVLFAHDFFQSVEEQ